MTNLLYNTDISTENSSNVCTNCEVDKILEEARVAGGRIVKHAQDTFWGGYSGYFHDLDGHLWEVAHNPHFWIGPEPVKS